jgi:hypothetical protein
MSVDGAKFLLRERIKTKLATQSMEIALPDGAIMLSNSVVELQMCIGTVRFSVGLLLLMRLTTVC